MREKLRRVFIEHTIFTRLFITSYFHNLPDVKVILKRLLRNQTNIGTVLEPKIGKPAARKLTALLKKHIAAAGDAMAALKNNPRALAAALEVVFTNSAQVAKHISSLNPKKIPYKTIKKMFDMHNKQVLKLAKLHQKKDYKTESRLFDKYMQHMVVMSDAIADAL